MLRLVSTPRRSAAGRDGAPVLALAGLAPVVRHPAPVGLAADLHDAARRPVRGRAPDLPPEPADPPGRYRRDLDGFSLPGDGDRPGRPARPAAAPPGDPGAGRPPARRPLAADGRRPALDLRDDVGRRPPDRHRDELV